MSIRNKVLSIVSVTVTLAIAVMIIIAQLVLLEDYRELEQDIIEMDIHRVQDTISNDVENLDIILFDWSAWDDSYNFATNPYDEYIDSNLVDETFQSYPLNLFLIADPSGETVYSKAYDTTEEAEVSLPEEFKNNRDSLSILFNHADEESVVKGFLNLRDGPMILSSRPIIHSDETGPVRGTMIMGRYLDPVQIQHYGDLTHTTLEVFNLNEPNLPDEIVEASAFVNEDNPIFTNILDRNSIAGYARVEDITERPILLLRVTSSREIYQQGLVTTWIYLAIIFTVMALSGIMTWFLLDRFVLSRIGSLRAATREIGLTRDFSGRIQMSGRDEISELARDTNSMLKELEAANSIKNEFLAAMSHELRTPLNSIIGFTELLSDEIPGTLNEDQKSSLNDVLSSSHHLLNLINDLLDISKVEAGKLDLDLTDFNIVTSVNDAVNGSSPLFSMKKQSLIVDLPQSQYYVHADQRLVQQVLLNLLGNANKFTPVSGKVTISISDEESAYRISITDNGIGIDQGDLERIFEDFVQIEGSEVGSGLGLKLTKKLVEIMNGRISVESELGRGSTFSFTLPASQI